MEAIERRTHTEVLYEIEFQAKDFTINNNAEYVLTSQLHHKNETAAPYQGEISIWFKNGVGKLTLYMIDVSSFWMKCDLEYGTPMCDLQHKSYRISKPVEVSKLIKARPYFKDLNPNTPCSAITIELASASFVSTMPMKGSISLDITDKPNNLDNFSMTLNHRLFKYINQTKEFKIKCLDQEFAFSKTILCSISSIFERMIQNTDLKEGKEGVVEIDDFGPETLETFQNIIQGNHDLVKNESLDVDLMMFGHKYQIQALVQMCKEYLSNHIDENNVFNVIEKSYLMDEEELFEDALKFIKDNLGEFNNLSEEWTNFQKSHPEFSMKMLNLMLKTKEIGSSKKKKGSRLGSFAPGTPGRNL